MNPYTKHTIKAIGLLATGFVIGYLDKRRAAAEAYSCGELSGYCDGVKVTAKAYIEKAQKEEKEKEKEP